MNTRQEALILGQKLLQTHGFNGFSFQDLADGLGIRKASLHYHFKSKQDLASALIEDFERQFKEWFLKVESRTDQDQLMAYFKIFISMWEDQQRICPIGAFCVELEALDGQVIQALNSFYTLQLRWLSSRFRNIHSSTYLKKMGGEDAIARYVLSSLQGALQTARLKRSPAEAKKHLQEHIHIIQNIFSK